MSDDESPPEVTVRCPDCETTTQVPLPEVADTIERHNERRHDGREVADVDPRTREHLADLVAEDLGLLGEG